MARGTTETVAETVDPAAVVNGQGALKSRASRKGMKRGPSTVFVKYEVLDGSGNVVSGYTARPVSITRDVKAMVAMVLNKTQDGEYMQLSIPNSTDASATE